MKVPGRFHFENPPNPNPPKETYYRRIVYAMALDRLERIAQDLDAFLRDSHTGKAYRRATHPGEIPGHGDVIGRGKGIMPTLGKRYPETKGWEEEGPRKLAKVIHDAKTPDYFELLEGAIYNIESERGEEIEAYVRTAPRAALDEFPPVIYPAHKGRRTCKRCRRPHPEALHRFHLAGSFERTHEPPPSKAEQRAERAERLKEEEVPF